MLQVTLALQKPRYVLCLISFSDQYLIEHQQSTPLDTFATKLDRVLDQLLHNQQLADRRQDQSDAQLAYVVDELRRISRGHQNTLARDKFLTDVRVRGLDLDREDKGGTLTSV